MSRANFTTVRLDSLNPGDRFRLPLTGVRGQLLHKGPGSCRVLLDFDRKPRTFKVNGESEVTIPASPSVQNISLTTEVVRCD